MVPRMLGIRGQGFCRSQNPVCVSTPIRGSSALASRYNAAMSTSISPPKLPIEKNDWRLTVAPMMDGIDRAK